MTAPERALLKGVQAVLQPLTPTVPGNLFELADAPDVQWSIGFTRGQTDPLHRWGNGILLLQWRGPRSKPLDVYDDADLLTRRLIAMHEEQLPGGVTVNTVDHRGTVTGPDTNRRTVLTASFALDLDYQA